MGKIIQEISEKTVQFVSNSTELLLKYWMTRFKGNVNKLTSPENKNW